MTTESAPPEGGALSRHHRRSSKGEKMQTIRYGKVRLARCSAKCAYSFEMTSIIRMIRNGRAAYIRAGIVKVA